MDSRNSNLLLAALAAQLDFLPSNEVIRVLQNTPHDETFSLGEKLVAEGLVTDEQVRFLASLVSGYLALHNQSVEECLASLSVLPLLKKALDDGGDADLEATVSAAFEKRSLRLGTTSSDVSLDRLLSRDSSERFRVIRPHAEGGLGEVSVAHDLEFNREVALKSIRSRFAQDAASKSRFFLEAEVTGQLEHPGIVPVYGLGSTSSGSPFYVMRFIRGSSLKQAIADFHSDRQLTQTATQRRLELRGLIRRLIDVCNAIEYAHSRGVLHRDLKPGNIMLGKYGETLVVDWGLAKTLNAGNVPADEDQPTFVPMSTEGSTETRMGTAVGTPAYMSPEQADGRLEDLGPSTDVYCLGATLYKLLSNKAPGQGKNAEEVCANITSGNIPPVKEISDADAAIAAICAKAMAVQQSKRYASASALANDLELYLADEAVTAYREPILRRAGRWLSRNRTSTVATLAALTVGLASMGLLNFIVQNKNKELAVTNGKLKEKSEALIREQEVLQDTRDSFRQLAFDSLKIAETELAVVPAADPFRTKLMTRAFETLSSLQKATPEHAQLLRELIKSARNLANQFGRTGDTTKATELMNLTETLYAQLPDSEKTETDLLDLVGCFRDIVSQCRKAGQLDEAIKAANKATDILKSFEVPASLVSRRSREIALLKLTTTGIHDQTLDHFAGRETASESVQRFQQLFDINESSGTDSVSLALATAWKGRMESYLGQHDEAKKTFATGLAATGAALEQAPTSANAMYGHARMLHWLADATVTADRVDAETLQLSEESVAVYSKMHELYPQRTGYQSYLADAYRVLAYVKHKLNDKTAMDDINQAVTITEDVCTKDTSPGLKGLLAEILRDRILIRPASAPPEESAEDIQRAIENINIAIEEVPESKKLRKLAEDLQSLKSE